MQLHKTKQVRREVLPDGRVRLIQETRTKTTKAGQMPDGTVYTLVSTSTRVFSSVNRCACELCAKLHCT